ncbi:MAG: ATP-grasp domain-containing protein [Oscillospiraceae bacterium]
MRNDFEVVILGNDINVYSVARAFYEEYGIISNAFGQSIGGANMNSKIVNYKKVMGIDKKDVFLPEVTAFCNEHKDKKVLILGCGDNYIEVIAECRDEYPNNAIIHCPTLEQIKKLIRKEDFYVLCDEYGIDYPSTKIITKDDGTDFSLNFGPPYIVKPSNSVMYWEYHFEGQNKVFTLKTREELDKTVKAIFNSGYKDKLIIQDFIPGDDTNMRVLTSYSDKNAKVKMMCLGHVLLEEHTPKGIGNHAVIITEKNEELMQKYKKFLEDLQFVGFSNFDIKYDKRDNKFKAFEINVRQGRSNFYVTSSGENIAKYLVEDRIMNIEKPCKFCDNEHLWLVIPKRLAFKFAPDYSDKLKDLIKNKKMTNPLWYKEDLGLVRFLRLVKLEINYFKKYKGYGGNE